MQDHAHKSSAPTTSNFGGASDRKAPPPKTHLYWASLTSNEKAVLDAMYEHCSDGTIVWASLQRLAAYCKLSRKTVQRVLNGDRGRPGLIKHGIVTQLASANPISRGVRKRRPATYRINAEALTEDPRMEPYQKRQHVLPGIRKPAAPGEPIEPRDYGPTVRSDSSDHGPTVHRTTDPRSTNPLKRDPEGRALTHHAAGAATLPAWLAIKELLRAELSPGEWDLWVRPARLLRVMGDGKTMQIAVPPNGAIMAAAVKGRQLLNDIAGRAGLSAVLTKYPDEWEREQLNERFGIAKSSVLSASAEVNNAKPDPKRERLEQQDAENRRILYHDLFEDPKRKRREQRVAENRRVLLRDLRDLSDQVPGENGAEQK